MNTVNKQSHNLIFCLLLVILWCALPGVCLFLNNAAEMPFRDILLPAGCSIALGVLCFLICLAIFRNQDFSALLTVVGMGLFLNFNFIIDLVNAIHPVERLRPYYITAAIIFAVFFVLLLLLKSRPTLCRAIVRLVLLSAASILAVTLIFSAPTLLQKSHAPKYQQVKTSEDIGVVRPNLYFLLFDEYASFSQIESQFGYDNSAFYDFLTESGFCVSDSSYNTSANSMINITALVNLEPCFTDANDSMAQWNVLNSGRLYSELENLGYDQYQLGNLFPLPALAPYAQAYATAENGAAATEILITNSMLRPFSVELYWSTVFESRDKILDYFNNPAHYAQSNRAVFFYICSPHVPFYRDANGNAIDPDIWQRPENYLGQFIFMTGKMKTMISSILENDPGAIILLQSDHGRRGDSTKRDRNRILNALYMGGEFVDITGMSGYNTWRTLLNELGGDFPLVPEPPIPED